MSNTLTSPQLRVTEEDIIQFFIGNIKNIYPKKQPKNYVL